MSNTLSSVDRIAIIRGITPDQALVITDVFCELGYPAIEVPLNSPSALESLRLMAAEFGDRMLVGAGTVLSVEAVGQVADAGGQFVVSPNTAMAVILETKRRNLWSLPGVFTVTECFSALDAGADALKLFPANVLGPSGLASYRAVLPADVPVFAVGGVTPENAADYRAAGATGIAVGGSVYRPGMSPEEVRARASLFRGLAS
jgi:2-dehydro-3-deoxyphosphogalactonate aldolase